MMGLLPYGVIAILALAIWGLFEQHKADGLKIDAQHAQIVQNERDRATSARQIAIAETKLEALSGTARPIIQQVMASPTTSGCGPVVGLAISGMQQLRSARDAKPGPQPAQPAGVPAARPAAAGGKTN